jgi:hypothetical protein
MASSEGKTALSFSLNFPLAASMASAAFLVPDGCVTSIVANLTVLKPSE